MLTNIYVLGGGGTQLGAMLEGLANTEAGAAVLARFGVATEVSARTERARVMTGGAEDYTEDYTREVEDLLERIDGDELIDDAEYIELMEKIAGLAEGRAKREEQRQGRANAKREELKRDED